MSFTGTGRRSARMASCRRTRSGGDLAIAPCIPCLWMRPVTPAACLPSGCGRPRCRRPISRRSGGLNAAPVIGTTTVPGDAGDGTAISGRNGSHLPGFLMAAAIFVAGLIALLLYLRERTQWLYLWLAIYLLADGLIGFRRLDAMNYGLHFVCAAGVSAVCGVLSGHLAVAAAAYAFRTERVKRGGDAGPRFWRRSIWLRR